MRRILILLALVVMLAGCSTHSKTEPESSNSTKKPSSAVIVNDIISRDAKLP